MWCRLGLSVVSVGWVGWLSCRLFLSIDMVDCFGRSIDWQTGLVGCIARLLWLDVLLAWIG